MKACISFDGALVIRLTTIDHQEAERHAQQSAVDVVEVEPADLVGQRVRRVAGTSASHFGSAMIWATLISGCPVTGLSSDVMPK